MMSRHTEIYLLAGLFVLLGLVLFFSNRGEVPGVSRVVAADTKFQPLDIEEPRLHLDLLDKVRKLEYSGPHRNIFVAAPPPLPQTSKAEGQTAQRFTGPRQPPPPPPLSIPAEFFGYASRPNSGKRVAFFTSGDDVLVVAEGDTFLGRFRLDHIGNDSADVEEISSGRHAIMPMVQPPPGQASDP